MIAQEIGAQVAAKPQVFGEPGVDRQYRVAVAIIHGAVPVNIAKHQPAVFPIAGTGRAIGTAAQGYGAVELDSLTAGVIQARHNSIRLGAQSGLLDQVRKAGAGDRYQHRHDQHDDQDFRHGDALLA